MGTFGRSWRQSIARRKPCLIVLLCVSFCRLHDSFRFSNEEEWVGGGMDQWERWQAQLAAAEAVDSFQGARGEEEASRYVVNQPKL